MLEADALNRVSELDVDPEVVAVELELVALPEGPIRLDLKTERRDAAVDVERPMHVAIGMSVEIDHLRWLSERGSVVLD